MEKPRPAADPSTPPRKSASAIARLDEGEQTRVIRLMTPGEAAALIDEMPGAPAAEIVMHLAPEDAAAIVCKMPSGRQAEIIRSLRARNAERVLAAMKPQDAKEARKLAQYPPDTAGGVMVTEFLAYPHTTPVGDVTE